MLSKVQRALWSYILTEKFERYASIIPVGCSFLIQLNFCMEMLSDLEKFDKS